MEDLFEATKLRDNGIKISADNAERVHNGWHGKADFLLSEFLCFKRHSADNKFLGEDVRKYAEDQGLAKPPSDRAWGSVMVRAARCGKVIKAGYALTTNSRAHRTPATLWTYA